MRNVSARKATWVTKVWHAAGERRRGSLRSMQNAVQYQPASQGSALTLVEMEQQRAGEVVGVSAAWRKLLMQAEMAAPHLQVGTIEGEHGSGKQTLARYVFGRSQLANGTFRRR